MAQRNPRIDGAVEKLETGIPGFDVVAGGGLPRNRTTLVAGTAGSGKTIFVTHFLTAGVARGERGVFVTFEDTPSDVRKNMRSFGWDIAAMERTGEWAFVDVSPEPGGPTPIVGSYDLGGLLSRILHAVQRVKATRVAIDSINALFVQFPDRPMIRAELHRISTALKREGVTVLFTAERTEEYGALTQFGIEEFVSDNVVVLRNLLQDERRRRTIEILKFRGAPHQRGEVPFTILDHGLVVLPLTAQQLDQESSTTRVTSGIPELDEMCEGGFFRDSIVLVSGATGTGKTLMSSQFLNGGLERGDRVLLFAFEESRDQLLRNAAAWGMNFEAAERQGALRIVNRYPHAMPMEDHLVQMRNLIEEVKPDRVAVDSLSALERVFSLRSFREFVISLTSALKRLRITGLFTSTTPSLLGGGSVTEKHISTLTDSIILLRYVETPGRMRRSISVLKMRGSRHDPGLREYTIDGLGMRIGAPFSDVSGILAGMPQAIAPGFTAQPQTEGA
ncbi:MAG TPA: circadian clock protein KaiC [Gemmatimonadaceae bacterium]|nr:circadian clock protein KaiC [Gemmatimonadaceae bacterium]